MGPADEEEMKCVPHGQQAGEPVPHFKFKFIIPLKLSGSVGQQSKSVGIGQDVRVIDHRTLFGHQVNNRFFPLGPPLSEASGLIMEDVSIASSSRGGEKV